MTRRTPFLIRHFPTRLPNIATADTEPPDSSIRTLLYHSTEVDTATKQLTEKPSHHMLLDHFAEVQGGGGIMASLAHLRVKACGSRRCGHAFEVKKKKKKGGGVLDTPKYQWRSHRALEIAYFAEISASCSDSAILLSCLCDIGIDLDPGLRPPFIHFLVSRLQSVLSSIEFFF